MRKLRRLFEAARAITPQAQVTFRGIPDREDWWVCVVSVGSVILVESSAGPPDVVLDEASKKLRGMSQKMKAAINEPDSSPDNSPPPSSR